MAIKATATCLCCRKCVEFYAQAAGGYCKECGALYVKDPTLEGLSETLVEQIKEKAEVGDSYSNFLLGRMHNCKENYKSALPYLKKATSADLIGDAFTMYAVAYFFTDNEKTKKDYQHMLKMVNKAEKLGSPFLNEIHIESMSLKETIIKIIGELDKPKQTATVQTSTTSVPPRPLETRCYYYLNGVCTYYGYKPKCHGWCAHFFQG